VTVGKFVKWLEVKIKRFVVAFDTMVLRHRRSTDQRHCDDEPVLSH
jgi:hypothetical protein